MPAGRPRTFDREEALKKAMMLFWKNGFEGTTMADIIAAIGMTAPSIYAAFGNKDQLFRASVELYKASVEQGPIRRLYAADDIHQAVVDWLNATINMLSADGVSGCLIMGGAINCTPENQSNFEYLKNIRQQYKDALINRFAKAKEAGQLLDSAMPSELANFYFSFMQGLAIQATDGASASELAASCYLSMSVLKSSLRDTEISSIS